jgi:predicted nuclease of predicted toxin-antitoxin system
MRFLADENFPGIAVAALIDAGHDVVWIRTAAPGLSDLEIIAWAARDRRTLLTFDKDFGQVTRETMLPASSGVILFRMPMPRASEAVRLASIVVAREDWTGHFSVITSGRIRMRKLA